jgi:hypothetical protein
MPWYTIIIHADGDGPQLVTSPTAEDWAGVARELPLGACVLATVDDAGVGYFDDASTAGDVVVACALLHLNVGRFEVGTP